MNVSVVITNYNYGRFIKESINSVLNQTYKNYEIIIVDDGSTDDSDKIIKPFLNKYNITYLKQNNEGQASALNSGIKKAKGDFIAFLDADDIWEEAKLEMQIPLFEKSNVGVVYSRRSIIDEKNNEKIKNPSKNNYFKMRRGKITDFLAFDNIIPFSSAVVRKEVFEKIGLFNVKYRMGKDWDMWLRISTEYEFDYVDKPLLKYRAGHSGQMSNNKEKRFYYAELIFKSFLTNYPNIINKKILKKVYYYNYLNRANYYLNIDKNISMEYLKKAFKLKKLHLPIYKILFKSFLI